MIFEVDYICCCSVSRVRLFVTPWTTARQASLSFTISRSLIKLMSTESVMPTNHLILCHPLLLLPSIFPNMRVFSNESALHIRWPKYWSFSFSISPSNEYPGLISLSMDWLDLLAVQGTLKSLLQHHSSKTWIFWPSAYFVVTFIHDSWKSRSFDCRDLSWQSNVSSFYIKLQRSHVHLKKKVRLVKKQHLNYDTTRFGEGNGNPFQCSFLENLMDRGAWQATVRGVTKSRTRRETHTHTIYKDSSSTHKHLSTRYLWNIALWVFFFCFYSSVFFFSLLLCPCSSLCYSVFSKYFFSNTIPEELTAPWWCLEMC